MNIASREDYQQLRSLIDDLDRRGQVAINEKGAVSYTAERRKQPKTKPNRITGTLSVNKRGFGFVTVEGMNEDVFIPPKSLKTALHGDLVEILLFAKVAGARQGRHRWTDDGNRIEGEVVRIIERTRTTVVGTLEQSARFWFVIPDDERLTRDIYVTKEDLNGAVHGDKVVAILLDWEDEQQNPEGKVVETLGKAGDARVEVLSVARSFGLPMQFPKEVEREAAQFGNTIPKTELSRRLDLRDTICCTIDPEDAKDFDDAVSFERLTDGSTRLGVHIADVSHYVREGSPLDREAYARGTSVYMVNEVIPMLPERLSNDLCSLKPNVDRLTYSVLMEVTDQGIVRNYSIRKSIIHSTRRFTYEEVQKIIESGKGELSDTILPLFKLTQTLLKHRRRNGSIDFDTGEAKFKFDKNGLPSQIIKKERLDAPQVRGQGKRGAEAERRLQPGQFFEQGVHPDNLLKPAGRLEIGPPDLLQIAPLPD